MIVYYSDTFCNIETLMLTIVSFHYNHSIVQPHLTVAFHEILLFLLPIPQCGTTKCVFRLSGHITAVKTLAFCPSGLALVSGGIGGLLNIWSLQVRKHYHSTLLSSAMAWNQCSTLIDDIHDSNTIYYSRHTYTQPK